MDIIMQNNMNENKLCGNIDLNIWFVLTAALSKLFSDGVRVLVGARLIIGKF